MEEQSEYVMKDTNTYAQTLMLASLRLVLFYIFEHNSAPTAEFRHAIWAELYLEVSPTFLDLTGPSSHLINAGFYKHIFLEQTKSFEDCSSMSTGS